MPISRRCCLRRLPAKHRPTRWVRCAAAREWTYFEPCLCCSQLLLRGTALKTVGDFPVFQPRIGHARAVTTGALDAPGSAIVHQLHPTAGTPPLIDFVRQRDPQVLLHAKL